MYNAEIIELPDIKDVEERLQKYTVGAREAMLKLSHEVTMKW